MSTKKALQEELQHGDEAAALPSPPEAHPLAGALTESLRQADEPPSEATLSPNPSHPDGPAGTAGALTGMVPLMTLPEPVPAAHAHDADILLDLLASGSRAQRIDVMTNWLPARQRACCAAHAAEAAAVPQKGTEG